MKAGDDMAASGSHAAALMQHFCGPDPTVVFGGKLGHRGWNNKNPSSRKHICWVWSVCVKYDCLLRAIKQTSESSVVLENQDPLKYSVMPRKNKDFSVATEIWGTVSQNFIHTYKNVHTKQFTAYDGIIT